MTDLTGARTYDSNDPQQIADRDKQALIRQITHEKLLREHLSTASGRNFYWDQLAACHVFEGIYPGENSDFLLGERNIGLRLLAQITAASPDALVLMLKERGNG